MKQEAMRLKAPEDHEDILQPYKRYGKETLVMLLFSVRKLKGFYTSWEKKIKTAFDKLGIEEGTYGKLRVRFQAGANSFLDVDKVSAICDKHGEDVNKLYSETKYNRVYIEEVEE